MKLKKQFKDFYTEIKIDNESVILQEKRKILESDIKDKLPSELDKHDISVNKTEISMFDQGSYKYHTTIKSEVVDRDVAVVIPLDITAHTDPRKVKNYLRNSISYVQARTVSIKEPCVRAVYIEDKEEWLHIDLPLYAEYNKNLYLARGKEHSTNYLWEIADPKGLNDDLCGKINGNEQLR